VKTPEKFETVVGAKELFISEESYHVKRCFVSDELTVIGCDALCPVVVMDTGDGGMFMSELPSVRRLDIDF